MFNGSNHFGKAYQQELLRAADYQEGGNNDSKKDSQAGKSNLLQGLLNWLETLLKQNKAHRSPESDPIRN